MSGATQIGRTVNGRTYTDAPVDVKLGPNTFRIPANYLDSQIAPWPGEGVTLVIEWPGMGPTAPGGRAHPRTNDFRKEILVSIDYIDRAPIETSLERLSSNEALTPNGSIERDDPRSRLDLRVPKADTLGLTTYAIDENKMAAYVQLYLDRRGKPPVRNPAFEDDWHIARDDAGKLATFIRCEAATYRGDGVRIDDGELADLEDPVAAGCVHYFTDVPNRLSIALHYKRVFLPDWKRMETAVRSVLTEARLAQLAPDRM